MQKFYVNLDEQNYQSREGVGASGVIESLLNIGDWFRSQTSLNIILRLLQVSIVLLAVGTAVIREGSLGWLFELKPITGEVVGELAIVLAPLTALALSIERLVETIFDYFESRIEDIAKLSNMGQTGFENFKTELENAWSTYNKITQKLKDASDEERAQHKTDLDQAEIWIARISQRLNSLPKDPGYIAYKRRISIAIAFLLGFIVAIITDKGLFEYLQIGVPRIVDMFITGAVLGAGSGPMHSLIGALDGLKTGLQNLGIRPALEK